MKTSTISALAAALALGLITPAVAQEWTGPYLTFGLSGSSIDLRTESVDGISGQSVDGVAPYVAAGYDWAFGDFTLGLMGDVDFGGVDEVDIVSAGKGLYGESDLFATLRGRAGMAVSEKMHVYASGGLAFMRMGATGKDGLLNVLVADSQTLTGGAVGLGGEYMLAPGRHLSFEYLYVDFRESDTYLEGSFTEGTFDPTVGSFRLGYTLRF